MKSHKSQFVMFCLVALVALFVSINAKADTWNKATKISFPEPVEVSGRVLPAGTYWFQLMDSPANRNIVQIWSADRMHLITTFLALPNYRLQPTEETAIKFAERPSGTPEAVKAWFYPGDNFGQEFIVPKAQPAQLARNVGEPVLAVREENAAPAPAAAPATPVQPSADEVEVGEVEMVAELPTTGSSLPLLGLLGLLAVAAGFGLRHIPTGDAA